MTLEPEVIVFYGCAIPDCERFPAVVLFVPDGSVRGFCIEHGPDDLEKYVQDTE